VTSASRTRPPSAQSNGAMAAIIMMEERPLHGPAAKVTPPVVPDAAPAE